MRTHIKSHQSVQKHALVSLISSIVVTTLPTSVFAESLFHAGIQYQAQQSYTPRSLYSTPRPSRIGDIVTITVNESMSNQAQNNTNLSKTQELTENSTSLLSRIVQSVTGIRGLLPSFSGLDTEKKTNITTTTQRTYTYQDTVSCQVVEILPNGSLMIQGKKALGGNTEKQVLYISGIVNPYYLDANNTIASNRVANLQVQTVGHGTLSDEQKEGFVNRMFRYVN
jgi:flagellar L-ring protein FlgH